MRVFIYSLLYGEADDLGAGEDKLIAQMRNLGCASPYWLLLQSTEPTPMIKNNLLTYTYTILYYNHRSMAKDYED